MHNLRVNSISKYNSKIAEDTISQIVTSSLVMEKLDKNLAHAQTIARNFATNLLLD